MNGCDVANHIEHLLVAYLPAASTMEAQLTSAQFDSSLFALASGEDFEEDSTYAMPVTETLPVQSGIVTLGTRETPVANSIKINGMTVTTGTPTTGTYKVETSGTTTTITFFASDFANGDLVDVHYQLTKSDAISMGVSNDKAAIGSADFIWPVYNGGENVSAASFTGASVMGWIVMHIYRVRITAMPKAHWAS